MVIFEKGGPWRVIRGAGGKGAVRNSRMYEIVANFKIMPRRVVCVLQATKQKLKVT